MKELTKALRNEMEETVLKAFSTIDKSGTNTDYYKKLFASMSDKQFVDFCKKPLCFRLHYRPSVVEPIMDDISKALKVINVPLFERVNLDFLYKNAEGKSVQTQECLVGYIPIKRQQQMITKKNKWATSIESRDISGRLTGQDKGSQMSERDFEGLAAFNLTSTMEEFAKPKGDAMEAKNAMYAQIAATGMVRMSDLPDKVEDSLARNLMSAYLMGCHIGSNLVNYDNYTQGTLKNK